MNWLFSDGFLRVANRLGVDASAELEKRYLEYARRVQFKNSYRVYDTGRGRFLEKPENVLKYYNDLKTVPSKETIAEASAHFKELTVRCFTDSDRVKVVARWWNKTIRYTPDVVTRRRLEYWSSPFDLWAEYKVKGFVEDDCDGYAVAIWWGCVLAGVDKNCLSVWVGIAEEPGFPEGGHANVLFFDTGSKELFHVEGSYLTSDNQRYWGKYVSGCKRYPVTWFVFDDEGSYRIRA